MKAIIMAGGQGTRLYPLTKTNNKHLLPIYNKPMIYYPLTILIAAGITQFCIVTNNCDVGEFQSLLSDGSHLGVSIEYRTQEAPGGIAEGVLIAENFIGSDSVAMMLGDNIFFGSDILNEKISDFSKGALIFACYMEDPRPFGVITLDEFQNPIQIQEKPTSIISNFAIPGVYLFDNMVIEYARQLKPSNRGELEITDIHQRYLNNSTLEVCQLSRGFVWIDSGSDVSMYEASSYIKDTERRQGRFLGCPEEAAFRRGLISLAQLESEIELMPRCSYRKYLQELHLEYQNKE